MFQAARWVGGEVIENVFVADKGEASLKTISSDADQVVRSIRAWRRRRYVTRGLDPRESDDA